VIGRWIVRGLAALGLLLVLVTATPLVRWWARALAGAWDDPRGDVLIVPAEPSAAASTIGGSSYWRSVYAARSYKQDGFRSVIVTGAGSSAAMRDLIVYLGVPRDAVRIEDRSSGARENALFSRDLVDAARGRKVLLTSDYHMFRARRAFRKAGLDVAPRPFPDVLKMSGCLMCRWQAFVTLSGESAKIAYYYARGWI
jgi:uncharacterized SAM-binding protein YcdF (DUF218 family)